MRKRKSAQRHRLPLWEIWLPLIAFFLLSAFVGPNFLDYTGGCTSGPGLVVCVSGNFQQH